MKNNKDKLLKKTFLDFLIKEIIWTIALSGSILLISFIVIMGNFQWVYDLSPNLYYFFKSLFYIIANLFELVIPVIIIWIVGTLILLYKLLKKVFSYIHDISKASEDLVNKNIEYIELPDELLELQNKLNRIKRESEKNERLAKESEQRKNDLIVYLAHDLKTPLTSTIGYLSLIDEIKDMPKKQREKYINIALEKSYRLEDLINELFEIARFNSETIVLEKEDVNLTTMLEQIVDDFYPVLKDANKAIKLDIKDKVTLYADPDKLARVFNNLIKNAINYSTDNIITMAVKKEKEDICIIIINKGKKISDEKLKRIFEKFYRTDSSRATKTGGSGLGLAIAKEIVELHNGTIKATSDDEYTKFYVLLPIKNLK